MLSWGSLQAQDLGVFKLWGTNTTEKVIAQAWRTSSDVISGWDWSLPPGVTASPNAFVNIPNNPNPGISCRNLDQLRLTWNELEPEEGKFNFELAKSKIAESLNKGYSGVVIRIWGALWEALSFPDNSIPLTRWPGGIKAAPRWLKRGNLDVPLIKMKAGGGDSFQLVNCDIMDMVYHEKYKKFIRALGESGIPAMKEVAIANLTYRSHSMGEEFTAYAPGESTASPEEINLRTRERLYAWAEAFGPNRHKLMWVHDENEDWPQGANYNDTAQSLGIGERNGFIEMYYAWCHRPGMGQTIGEDRHLYVDENNAYIKNGVSFGDENEEYEFNSRNEKKFGKFETFGYRYMMSTLMMLKMRRNYAMLWTKTLNPELLYWMGLELGRKVADAPDVWCWLNEAYLSDSKSVSGGKPGPVKNIERWLTQRDATGYETEPYLQIPLTKVNWYADPEKPYDYVTRRGKKIGFAIDDRWLSAAPQKTVVKITFYDGVQGTLALVYNDGGGEKMVSCKSQGTSAFKTATFFITLSRAAKGLGFDFEIRSEERVPLNMVRLIKQS